MYERIFDLYKRKLIDLVELDLMVKRKFITDEQKISIILIVKKGDTDGV